VNNRDVEILDLARLRAFSRSTRGLIEEPLRMSSLASGESAAATGAQRGVMARVAD
jgi:hypothetical protein